MLSQCDFCKKMLNMFTNEINCILLRLNSLLTLLILIALMGTLFANLRIYIKVEIIQYLS